MSITDIEYRVNNSILIEKYKPLDIQDVIIGNENDKKKFEEYISTGEMPNLLFHSRSPGTGKSTMARILSTSVSNTVKHLNASLARGIDVIRNEVGSFCKTESFRSKYKIVVFEEFDNVTYDAQKALLDLIEDEVDDVRFILTCNHADKVIDAIKSRTQQYKFGDIKTKIIAKRIQEILKLEKIEYEPKNVISILRSFKSDVRSILQEIQRLTITDGDKRVLSPYVSQSDSIKNVVSLLKEGRWSDCRKLIAEKGLNGEDVLKFIFRNDTLLTEDTIKRAEVTLELAEGLYRMKSGTDPEVQLAATIYSIMKIV